MVWKWIAEEFGAAIRIIAGLYYGVGAIHAAANPKRFSRSRKKQKSDPVIPSVFEGVMQ